MSREYRQKIVNVGCIGKFFLNYYQDGDWEIILQTKEHGDYIAAPDTDRLFFHMINQTTATIPEWMWDSFMQNLNELSIEMERDGLHTPYMVGEA